MKSEFPVQPRVMYKPLSPFVKAVYLAAVTVGLGLTVIGNMWMMELGCAVVLTTQILARRYFDGTNVMTRARPKVGWGIVIFALSSGTWMFVQAYRGGFVWQRTPPQWWWVAFISVVWLMVVVTELRNKAK